MYASTAGGLLKFNPLTEKFTAIKMEEGLVYLDLFNIEIDSNDRLWLGGAYPNGFLQVYDPDKGLVRKITHLDIAQIGKIQIGKDIAFAVYEGATSSDIGILEFTLDSGELPVYKDYFNHFSSGNSITEIRDLDLFSDSIFVTTDAGIFAGNYKFDNLKSATGWQKIFTQGSAMQYLPELGIIVSNGVLLQKNGDNWGEYLIGIEGDIVQATVEENGEIKILTQSWYYEIQNTEIVYSFEIPKISHAKSNFTTYNKPNDKTVYFGMNQSGILQLNIESGADRIFIPNTPAINNYHALTVTKNGHLAATSTHGSLIWNHTSYYNVQPWQHTTHYPRKNVDWDGIQFIWTYLTYRAGEHFPISIVEKPNGILIYCNSGSLPDSTIWLDTPAVVELDINTKIFASIGNDDEIIDGWWGIYNDVTFSYYMVINQIVKDQKGNIWVTNPFCEKYGNMIAIQSKDDGTWSHIQIPDENSYRPQTIALDKANRAWVGFAYESLGDTPYSSGGIKVLKYSGISFADEDDSTWLTIANPEVLPGGSIDASVWSIVFDKMDFLWILNEKGIRYYDKYVFDNTTKSITLTPFSYNDIPVDYLSNLSYTKGNRFRVDSQNNKWIITHQGVWVIKESTTFWPSEEGLHPDNSGLLSDIVYDVAFDNDKGLAYLATDKGISVLQIPFAENPSKKQSIYISPNPFIIPNDEGVIIKNVPSGSIIKIMTITGSLIKEFQLSSNESQAIWDGTNTRGDPVGTAVYLVSAHHPSERNKVSKIAVIRN